MEVGKAGGTSTRKRIAQRQNKSMNNNGDAGEKEETKEKKRGKVRRKIGSKKERKKKRENFQQGLHLTMINLARRSRENVCSFVCGGRNDASGAVAWAEAALYRSRCSFGRKSCLA